MRGKTRRTRRVRWLAALLGAFVLALSVMPVTAWAAGGAVYVSESGNDVNTGVDENNAVKTLAKAVEIANDGDTVYVMTDLTMTAPARFWDKHLTITSSDTENPVTVTRGDTMAAANDEARLDYNSAMLEVNVTGGTASLTLENIVFDDDGKHVGEYYIQADSEGDGNTTFGDRDAIPNTDIVQDAIVATYESSADIILGDGAVLKNYGGVSAVRLAGGKMTMLSGSKICDDEIADRTQGTTIPGNTLDYSIVDLYGPAGAVWMQGGTLVMERGSEITGIVGRSIINEGGTATIDGTISGMVADPKSPGNDNSDFWHGNNGAAIYLRSEASATLGSTGVIDGKGQNPGWSTICVSGYIDENGAVRHCTFTADEGSKIKDISGGSSVIDVGGTAYLNGEITGLKRDGDAAGHAIVAQSSSKHYIRIGETANIHDNVCAYGVIYTQGANGVIDIYGKINDNVSTDRGGALVLANNGDHVEAKMYEGAEMRNNVSYQTGGAVMVSCGTFTMNGGTISGNISGAGTTNKADQVGGGVYVRRGGQFIMNGGSISSNASANVGGSIAIEMGDYNNSVPYVRLNGGSVSGGMMNATVSEDDGSYSATDGTSNDITIVSGDTYGHMSRYLSMWPLTRSIVPGFLSGRRSTLAAQGTTAWGGRDGEHDGQGRGGGERRGRDAGRLDGALRHRGGLRGGAAAQDVPGGVPLPLLRARQVRPGQGPGAQVAVHALLQAVLRHGGHRDEGHQAAAGQVVPRRLPDDALQARGLRDRAREAPRGLRAHRRLRAAAPPRRHGQIGVRSSGLTAPSRSTRCTSGRRSPGGWAAAARRCPCSSPSRPPARAARAAARPGSPPT
nr:hypothetical protein [Thermophilibacter mediterraneus]